MRDTSVGGGAGARRDPRTGRAQPGAAQGGLRGARRARQGLARGIVRNADLALTRVKLPDMARYHN